MQTVPGHIISVVIPFTAQYSLTCPLFCDPFMARNRTADVRAPPASRNVFPKRHVRLEIGFVGKNFDASAAERELCIFENYACCRPERSALLVTLDLRSP